MGTLASMQSSLELTAGHRFKMWGSMPTSVLVLALAVISAGAASIENPPNMSPNINPILGQCYNKCAEDYLVDLIRGTDVGEETNNWLANPDSKMPSELSHHLEKRQVGPIIDVICKFAQKIP